MKAELITMLTHDDKTIRNARAIFEETSDLPIQYWGFKDVGIDKAEMRKLVADIKAAGKKAVLEVVTYTEAECLAGAEFACEYGFDYLMGTLYFPSVWYFLQEKPIEYFPFIGQVCGSPSILSGCLDGMLEEAERLNNLNIPGVDILAYRYCKGDPVSLAREVCKRLKQKVVIAGSIDSIDRIKSVNQIDPWGFTIGSALFAEKFVASSGVRDNLQAVLKIMSSLQDVA